MKRKKSRILPTDEECLSLHKNLSPDTIKRYEYPLTEMDRVTAIYGLSTNKITLVINVSYEILIENKWITIVRFDSSHGFLHMHRRISLENPDTVVESITVTKKSSPKDWLPWATKYMNQKFYDEKIDFCKRSKIKIIDLV